MNGAEAIEIATEKFPDIILLDIMMPEINGFDTCKKLKKMESTKEIPIIFITAISNTDSKIEGFNVGAVDYITKPFEYGEVRARLKTHLTLRKLQRQLEQNNEQLKQEITERKRAETTLKRTLQKLESKNQELEKFAYVVSHDLREPLRGITTYIKLLQKKCKTQMDEKAHEYMEYIVESADRMKALIQKLLKYSRIGTTAKDFREFDLNYTLDRVLSDLKVVIVENNADIVRQDMPRIWGDETCISLLFQNLISNAIKFSSESERPKIEITAEQKEGRWQFCVSDNGIGIDPNYQDEIFRMFQRVDSDSKSPGTGIGLAICKKIVDNHNGKIWVESELGNGSDFYFTLPDKPIPEEKLSE
jgi:light-regulated signal transduction histidine kinase (bacteriophytochrome)